MAIVVIPNHLDNLDFIKEWDELKQHEIIIVQDIGRKPLVPKGFNITIYDHKDIEKDLGDKAWIIPTGSSACRSYGYYKAWQRKPDHILTLDNDCYSEHPTVPYWVENHIDNLESEVTLNWYNSSHKGLIYRGFPYLIRNNSPVYLSHGLWSNVPDLDAATSLHYPKFRLESSKEHLVIPRYNFFPMCGMNLAWRSELTPALYFGLFGADYGFDQFDDIWAGVLVKKVLDHLDYAVLSGWPSVEHRKQSDVFVNMKKQAPGMAMNEVFWKVVRDITLTNSTVTSCYRELITKLPDVIEHEPTGWTKKFKQAALLWIDLFE